MLISWYGLADGIATELGGTVMHYLMDNRDVSSSDGGRVVVDIYHVDSDTGAFVYVCRCYTFARLLHVVRNMRHAGMTEATYTEYGRFYTDYQHNCYN